MSRPSWALTKRQNEASLMLPPPPPKRIKRPSSVLDEDVYTEALSNIIARDYFPGLVEARVKQEYLEALDSKDTEWIATSKKKLTDLVMTRARGHPCSPSATATPRPVNIARPGDTPIAWGGDTPMSMMSTASSKAIQAPPSNESSPDISNVGLLDFQAKFTSEDNESFNKLLDKQNAKRREKYAWIWSGNKIPTARQIAHRRREDKRIEGQGGNPDKNKQIVIKTNLDARPAKPDSWRVRPENSLMFMPSSVEDSYESIQQKADAASRAGAKQVAFHNTRLPDESLHASTSEGAAPPPSPSMSAIKDAIAGRPRATESEVGYEGGETPRVNGYAFVDEDEPGPEQPIASTGEGDQDVSCDGLRLLGSGDATPNPFQIRENRKREDLHHRMITLAAHGFRVRKDAHACGSEIATPNGQYSSTDGISVLKFTEHVDTNTEETQLALCGRLAFSDLYDT
ncbi:hypothetical protein EYZ11_007891 [Aspergillus tanneri]|uniref:Nuclear protein DGCR14 n=1 Tax=Aspergillus tanneri TaxID=1220188 RepID=A0A4V3UNV9_9EURO|nr:hypothetical protein EYZ11_007891 [Aspergillus tanneri]